MSRPARFDPDDQRLFSNASQVKEFCIEHLGIRSWDEVIQVLVSARTLAENARMLERKRNRGSISEVANHERSQH